MSQQKARLRFSSTKNRRLDTPLVISLNKGLWHSFRERPSHLELFGAAVKNIYVHIWFCAGYGHLGKYLAGKLPKCVRGPDTAWKVGNRPAPALASERAERIIRELLVREEKCP